MNLKCLDNIITDGLAIHIDITKFKSWDLNSGLTVNSLSKWKNAISDNIQLLDYGLTAFDIGNTNIMWSGITLNPNDVYFNMKPIGFNVVNNPTTEEYTGVTVTTEILPISGITITSGDTGNYFSLNGGYLNGFFKLDNYTYELLPPRFNKGLTIETLVYLYPDSQGIFYLMGVRAEDKYNPYFSGETVISGNTGNLSIIDGVISSEDNYLEGISPTRKLNDGFGDYLNMYSTVNVELENSGNTTNNVIAFEITKDKGLSYKYIDNNNIIKFNYSKPNIIPISGWTMIDILFKPYDIFANENDLKCAEQRLGDLKFYINGRLRWKIKDFPEMMFKGLNNDREKQIGVPYNISWGGGSFGLKHSYHYDFQTYSLYSGQTSEYINNNFYVESNPYDIDCPKYPPFTPLSGLTFSGDNETFFMVDECTGDVIPVNVMKIEYTGNTTGNTTGNSYFIKFNQPLSVLSNRNYTTEVIFNNDNFFYNPITGQSVYNKISLGLYGSEDINILNETYFENHYIKNNENQILKTTFNIKDNTGKQEVYIGILIETDHDFNINQPLFIFDFKYTGQDILTKDERKNNLLIEQNFDSSIICDLQKLRIYERALSANEILHNVKFEIENKSDFIANVKKGGRLIYK